MLGLGLFRRVGIFTSLNSLGNVLRPPILQSSRGMANHRHKKVLKLARGFRGRSSRCFTVAYHRVQKARQYAYRDRKVKKRDFRSLWIQRINAGSRMYGLTYSTLINSMSSAKVALNRKVLADIAVTEPLSVRSVVSVIESITRRN